MLERTFFAPPTSDMLMRSPIKDADAILMLAAATLMAATAKMDGVPPPIRYVYTELRAIILGLATQSAPATPPTAEPSSG